MSGTLIGLVTVIYIAVSFSFYNHHNPGMAICFFGYALANLGIIMATLK